MTPEQPADDTQSINDREFFHALADVCGHVANSTPQELAHLHEHADAVADAMPNELANELANPKPQAPTHDPRGNRARPGPARRRD
jgi:hypothetical protein